MIDLDQEVVTRWNGFNKKHYENFGYIYPKKFSEFTVKVRELMLKSAVVVKYNCDYCGKELSGPYVTYNRNTKNNTIKCACDDCSGKKYSEYYDKETYFNRIVEKCKRLGYVLKATIDDYKNHSTKLPYECPKHGIKYLNYGDFICQDSICSECATEIIAQKLKLDTGTLINNIESKNNNVLLNPEDYINTTTKNLWVKCGMCGIPFLTSYSSICNGDGACIDCAHIKSNINSRLSSDEVKRRIDGVNNNILLNPDEYYSIKALNLKIQCSCGNIYTTSLGNYEYCNVNKCQICSQRTSKSELLVAQVLDKYKIDYEPEYKFYDCIDIRPLPFDFYSKVLNLCIECDGQHHYKPIFSQEDFEKTQKHDKIKNEYCKKNGIRLIRIPYWEFGHIEEVLIRELNLQEIKLIKYPLK